MGFLETKGFVEIFLELICLLFCNYHLFNIDILQENFPLDLLNLLKVSPESLRTTLNPLLGKKLRTTCS